MAEARPLACPRCGTFNPPRARFCQHCRFRIVIDVPDAQRYRIKRVIKSGGMGAVYEALDDDERRYAVKELLDRFGSADERVEAVARFVDEATLLERMTHARIPRVYDNFTDTFVDRATGERRQHYYLVMDFVQGEDLEQIVEREGAQPEARVLMWADQLCDVLGYLHTRDLIYRDMKPSNVMIDRADGGVKLIDFGIAKVFQPAERGALIGTPGYSPPEQYQGLATPASDIYALGATLHHLLTGRDPRDKAPFSFPSVRELRPDVSPRAAEAIDRALHMSPPERWGSMAEFRQALLGRTEAPTSAEMPAEVLARPADEADMRGHTAPPAPRPRAGLLRRLLRLLLPLLLLGVPTWAYLQYPELVHQYLPTIEQVGRYIPLP